MMNNTIEQERADAEQQYTITAFDYVKNPVGSHEWCIYWQAWQASAQLQRERQAQPTPSQSELVGYTMQSELDDAPYNVRICWVDVDRKSDAWNVPLYTKPQLQPQSVKDALQQAAKECEEWAQAVEKVGTHKHKEGEIFAYNNAAEAIRALIQTEKGEL